METKETLECQELGACLVEELREESLVWLERMELMV